MPEEADSPLETHLPVPGSTDLLQLPFVSVIVPVYCNQTGITACLVALGTQTYPRERYEVLVVDNGSDPPITLDSHSSRFARIVLCRTAGAYAARNAGISVGQGDVLAFTDADCVPDCDWIRAGVVALQRAHGRCLIGGEVRFCASRRASAIERYQHLTSFMQVENIEGLGFTATASLFATRAQIQRVGPFDERLLSGGDREWCWRAAAIGFSVKYAPEAIVHTAARASLTSAILQARRVSGGRFVLRRLGIKHVLPSGLKPHRSVAATANWILTRSDLTFLTKCKVLTVAALLKVVRVLEHVRLSIGARPERR